MWAVKATYDDFTLVGEDLSPVVLNLSPIETPFLDLLGPPPAFATSTDHQWQEEALGPDTVINSIAINSATAATPITINGSRGNQLQAGMILEMQTNTAGQQNELLQISSVNPSSILVTRAFGGTTPNSLVAGGTLTVVATAELEGSTTTGDVNRPPTGRRNYCQIFKKPISITGTGRSVKWRPDLGDEFDRQKVNRTREVMRDLEKAVFRGRLSGNSIGSATAYRTLGGLKEFITGINSVIVNTSFAADPLLYTNNLMQECYNAGGRDLDVIVAGPQWKRELSAVGSTTRTVPMPQEDTRIIQFRDYLQTDFGTCRLVLSPWLNGRELFAVNSRTIFIVPMRGRSFQFEQLAKTGDSDLGHVIGEYTLEIHHPDKMAHAYS